MRDLVLCLFKILGELGPARPTRRLWRSAHDFLEVLWCCLLRFKHITHCMYIFYSSKCTKKNIDCTIIVLDIHDFDKTYREHNYLVHMIVEGMSMCENHQITTDSTFYG
jgi:hypothetical protein